MSASRTILWAASGPIFGGRCVCRANPSEPFDLALDSASEGIWVVVGDSGSNQSRIISIEWKPPPNGKRPSREWVRLTARSATRSGLVEIPIVFQEQP
jgi:hypothetical protein